MVSGTPISGKFMRLAEEKGFPVSVGEVTIEFKQYRIAGFTVERSEDDPQTNGLCETLFERVGNELFE